MIRDSIVAALFILAVGYISIRLLFEIKAHRTFVEECKEFGEEDKCELLYARGQRDLP